MPRTIKTLLFSTLYPSAIRPGHGIFVETRLRELLKLGGVETKVMAPVPWFPFTGEQFGEYGKFAETPTFEHRNGIDVFHPRYFLPPKIGMNIAPYTLARGAAPTIRKMIRDGFDFDLIDAHYYYPDGIAAALLAKWFAKPFVVTARGSDVNLIANYAIPQRFIRWAAERAKVSITVSRALSESLACIGARQNKLTVLRNGVNLEHFQPTPQIAARADLGWPNAPTLISVGSLVENKGHHIAIQLLAQLTDFRLVIIGSGPEREPLETLAQSLDVTQRVSFTGRIAQENLPIHYSAADILILASSREGWPNVLLEAMACGTPVVATTVGGIPEIVTKRTVGRLTPDRSVEGFLPLVKALWKDHPERVAVRRHAEEFSWQNTSQAQLSIFRRIVADEPISTDEEMNPAEISTHA